MLRSLLICSLIITASAIFTPASAQVVGDVNGDGQFNQFDILFVNRARLGFTAGISPQGMIEADTNADGSVDSTDYLNMARAFFGQPVLFRTNSPDKVLVPGQTLQLIGRNLTTPMAQVSVGGNMLPVALSSVDAGLEFVVPLGVTGGDLQLTQQMSPMPQTIPDFVVGITAHFAGVESESFSITEGDFFKIGVGLSQSASDFIEVTPLVRDLDGVDITSKFAIDRTAQFDAGDTVATVSLQAIDNSVLDETQFFRVSFASARRGADAKSATPTSSVIAGVPSVIIELQDNDGNQLSLDLDPSDKDTRDVFSFAPPFANLDVTPEGVELLGSDTDLGGYSLTIDYSAFEGFGEKVVSTLPLATTTVNVVVGPQLGILDVSSLVPVSAQPLLRQLDIFSGSKNRLTVHIANGVTISQLETAIDNVSYSPADTFGGIDIVARKPIFEEGGQEFNATFTIDQCGIQVCNAVAQPATAQTATAQQALPVGAIVLECQQTSARSTLVIFGNVTAAE